MSVFNAIRNDRQWQGPRLALGCFGGLALLAGLGVGAAVGPSALSNAIGSLAAVLIGYGLILYNRQGVEAFLPMWGLSGVGWFATLLRGVWFIAGLILVGASISFAVEAVKAL